MRSAVILTLGLTLGACMPRQARNPGTGTEEIAAAEPLLELAPPEAPPAELAEPAAEADAEAEGEAEVASPGDPPREVSPPPPEVEPQEDAAGPPELPATEVAPDLPPEETPPSCLEASPCDDGNPCTGPDSCKGGVCFGPPMVCADDGNPCTAEGCLGGNCVSSPLSTGSCEDGDPCTVGDACLAGSCKPGKPDPSCAPTCVYHSDCYPERVCGYWESKAETVCSDPCSGTADCLAGQVCVKVPGSSQVGHCHFPAAGQLGPGNPCVDSTQCSSGLCFGNLCRATCLDEGHCPSSDVCAMIGDPQAGLATAACLPAGGMVGNYQPCTDPQGYTGDVCASGACDLVPYALAKVEPLYCTPLCKTQSDCLPEQECTIVLASESPHPAPVIYDAQLLSDPKYAATLKPHDTVTACTTRITQGGSKKDGQVCEYGGQCVGGQCLGLFAADPTTYCTRLCTLDADCPDSGMRCKLELITVTSPTLQYFGTPHPEWWTYVRICKFE